MLKEWHYLKGFGGVASFGEVCEWGWTLKLQNHKPGPVSPSLPATSFLVLGVFFLLLLLLFCLFVCFCLFFGFFWDRVSLYSPDCRGTHSVDQAGLELRNLPVSASRVLGLKACATTPSLFLLLIDPVVELSAPSPGTCLWAYVSPCFPP